MSACVLQVGVAILGDVEIQMTLPCKGGHKQNDLPSFSPNFLKTPD